MNSWFHKWQAVFWAMNIPVAALTGLKDSVVYLVFISLMALVIGAIGAYQQSKSEIKMEKMIKDGEK